MEVAVPLEDSEVPSRCDPASPGDVDSCRKYHRTCCAMDEEPSSPGGGAWKAATATRGGRAPCGKAVLAFEIMSDETYRTYMSAVTAGSFVSLVSAVILIVVKLLDDGYTLVRRRWAYYLANAVLASVLMAATLACCVHVGRCVSKSRNLTWSTRRRRAHRTRRVLLVNQLVYTTFYLASSAYAYSKACSLNDNVMHAFALVRWLNFGFLFLVLAVMANDASPTSEAVLTRGRIDLALIDKAFWKNHWPELGVWLVWVGGSIATAVILFTDESFEFEKRAYWCDELEALIEERRLDCSRSAQQHVVLAINTGAAVLFLLIYAFYMARALVRLSKIPYRLAKYANINARMILYDTSWVFFVMIVSFVGLVWIDPNSCGTVITTYAGELPMAIASTVQVIAVNLTYAPKCDGECLLHCRMRLQDWAYTERNCGLLKAIRRMLSGDPAMNREPMFCIETAVKLLAWSTLVYLEPKVTSPAARTGNVGEDRDTQHHLCGFCCESGKGGVTTKKIRRHGVAVTGGLAGCAEHCLDDIEDNVYKSSFRSTMATYGLTDYRIFHERGVEFKAIVAWSSKNIVLAFRGTSNQRNAIRDMQAWRVPHLPKRGRYLCCTQHRVHKGFYRTYTSHNVQKRIVQAVVTHILTQSVGSNFPNVYITGHSLGGALAVLAADDIKAALPWLPPANVRVYTFGAPRVGNHPFARNFNARVPECWSVVNGRDLVATGLKMHWLGNLYKSNGHKVYITAHADCVVRPTFIEDKFLQGGPASVGDHFCGMYAKSLLSITKSEDMHEDPTLKSAFSLLASLGILHENWDVDAKRDDASWKRILSCAPCREGCVHGIHAPGQTNLEGTPPGPGVDLHLPLSLGQRMRNLAYEAEGMVEDLLFHAGNEGDNDLERQ